MKKTLLCVVLLAGICVFGFAGEDKEQGENNQPFKCDLWYTAGLAFGNYFMNGADVEKCYIGSPGGNVTSYALFGDKNMGVFFNYGYLLPAINSINKNYKLSVQYDSLFVGFGYGLNINENFKLYFGIGPNINALFLHTKEDDATTGNYYAGLGIGGDIGLKFRFAKFLCINAGTTVTYNFAGYRVTRNDVDSKHKDFDIDDSGWVNRYFMLGVKPYVTFGFNYYKQK